MSYERPDSLLGIDARSPRGIELHHLLPFIAPIIL
jgi:hypothetical protein